MIIFQFPWLFLCWLMPLLVIWLCKPYRENTAAIRMPDFQRMTNVESSQNFSVESVRNSGFWMQAVLWVTWTLVVVSLAKPQWLGPAQTKIIPTRDILLAVDLSSSMEKKDFTLPNGENVDRLSGVKNVVDRFLERRDSDRIGLVFFGSGAFVQSPFTEDIDVCRLLLDEAKAGMAGPQTMLGDAIGVSIQLFEQSKVKDRLLILLTDGNDSGSKVPPEQAANIANDYHVTIHTIAVGPENPSLRDAIDETTLKAISNKTGGSFFKASNQGELEGVYQQIDALSPSETEVFSHRPKRELFHWPLGVGLSFIFMVQLIKIFLRRG